ncbi:MAG: GYD domain-containing protein [Desulfatiglandales bacterium]
MPTFIMLTRLSPDSVRSPKSLEELERQVMERIRTECPQVEWVHDFAVLGPYDYLDIFRAPDTETAFKVATIIRTFGHAQTEVWTATEWAKFKDMVRHLPGGGE